MPITIASRAPWFESRSSQTVSLVRKLEFLSRMLVCFSIRQQLTRQWYYYDRLIKMVGLEFSAVGDTIPHMLGNTWGARIPLLKVQKTFRVKTPRRLAGGTSLTLAL
jgi:hypothetical protein